MTDDFRLYDLEHSHRSSPISLGSLVLSLLVHCLTPKKSTLKPGGRSHLSVLFIPLFILTYYCHVRLPLSLFSRGLGFGQLFFKSSSTMPMWHLCMIGLRVVSERLMAWYFSGRSLVKPINNSYTGSSANMPPIFLHFLITPVFCEALKL